MRLECTDDGHAKFWEATLEGVALHVRWGKIGTDGQRKSHTFASADAAKSERDKLVREKTRKGYVLVAGDAPDSRAPEAPTEEPPPKPAHAPDVTSTLLNVTKRSIADARALAATLAPTKRTEFGVDTWTLERGSGDAREYFEVSVSGAEIEIARGKVGKTGRVRSIERDEGETVDARVRRELTRALVEGFSAASDLAPTPDVMDAAASMTERARAFMQRHAQPAFVPEVDDGEGAILGSRFGGRPALAHDERAPTCGCCSMPLKLIAQIRSDELPETARRAFPSGLVQLFWCDTACQSDAAGWDPFSKANLARAVALPTRPRWPNDDEVPAYSYAPRRIHAWSEMPTYPKAEDIDELIPRDEDLRGAVADLEDEEIAKSSRGGTRVLGWPAWLQGKMHVRCPCGSSLRPILQVDSGRPLPGVAFGDTGIAWMLACARCHRMTFAWQSC